MQKNNRSIIRSITLENYLISDIIKLISVVLSGL